MATKRVLQGQLADVHIKNWIRAGLPVAKSDGGGLTFTLSKSGTATWVLRYRMPGRRAEATIGNYPDITLAEARREAGRLRAMIDAGKDPAADKREAKQKARAAKTIDWLADDYRAKVMRHLAPNSQTLYERQLRRIVKAWRGRAVEGVAPGDVIDVIRATKGGFTTDTGGWRETEALYIVTREVFKHAAGQHIIQVNPAMGISLESLIGKRPKAKVRLMLTDEELALVMRAAGMNRQNQLSVWIVMATCVRVSEFTTALREHVRTDQHTIKRLGAGVWHIPASKTGPAMDIPLAPPVVEWFRELDALALDSRYIVPARSVARLRKGGGDAPIGKDAVWGAIGYWFENAKPDVRPFTPHDLRSTAKSHMRALGVDRDISEMCLNHKLKGVEGIYDQYSYWKERREALALWADHLLACRGADVEAAGTARNALAALRAAS
ncbi:MULTISPECIES: tyrosine-type recombinase/integrase [Achromobacter]|uniref:tyrosine-type recombinase/integrase n=1 Tax=Achromobacter TaxID=222 RepID=UPI0006BF42AE|nr:MULTISPECIES: site-specific integrase [Achromobacter]MDF3943286.1 site-specific integrase [Achromobacter denitrificans]QQE57485.1 site-specific integrase [Achromobacter xylosoxidans]QQV17124.1 site-specific integrase [Achromobacter xylosoxidans]CUJ45771.1 Putative prophage CPS-53 integrase [Achromobacter xylosoxidans]